MRLQSKVVILCLLSVLIIPGRISGVDLSPWLPKEAPMTSASDLGVEVVSGLLIEKAPLTGWELANTRAITVDAHENILICGNGFIHKLIDSDEDGQWDESAPFTRIKKNYYALCARADSLMVIAEDGLWEFSDPDGNGQSNGLPKKLASWRLKPESFPSITSRQQSRVVISGQWNSVDIQGLKDNPYSGILEYDSETGSLAPMAHGFNNPTSLVVNLYHDTLCFDSGITSMAGFPEYAGSRFLHVAPGIHHGFDTQPGQSHLMSGHFPQSIPPIYHGGNISITGMAEYRSFNLPTDFFYGGIFGCDRIHGRLVFYKLDIKGSSYVAKPYSVIESSGTHGWSPTCLTINPQGEVMVVSSQLNGPGGLYILKSSQPGKLPPPESELDAVIRVPQPFDPWSYKNWAPLAEALDQNLYFELLVRESPSLLEKLAAMDGLIELPDSVTLPVISQLMDLIPHELIAHYYAGRPDDFLDADSLPELIRPLLKSKSLWVQRKALELLQFSNSWHTSESRIQLVFDLCQSRDPHIRGLARREFFALQDEHVDFLKSKYSLKPAGDQVLLAVHDYNIHSDNEAALEKIYGIVNESNRHDVLLDCFSLFYQITELNTGAAKLNYQIPDATRSKWATLINRKVKRLFPSRNEPLDWELARITALTRAFDEVITHRILNEIHPSRPTARCLHFLQCLNNSDQETPKRFHRRIAQFFIKLARTTPSFTWLDDQEKLSNTRALIKDAFNRWEWLPEALSRTPGFPSDKDGLMIQFFETSQLDSHILEVIDNIDKPLLFQWDNELVRALTFSSIPNKLQLLGQIWNKRNGRKPILEYLSQNPTTDFLNVFIESLDHADPEAQALALTGISRISPQPSLQPGHLGAIVRAASRPSTPISNSLKSAISKLVVTAPSTYGQNQSDLQWKSSLASAFLNQFPEHEKFLQLDSNDDPIEWRNKVAGVDWSSGDPEAGKVLFTQRTCVQCHSPESTFGPPLENLQTMTPEDLFTHTVFPHMSVHPEFQTWMVQGENIKFLGMMVENNHKTATFTMNSRSAVRVSTKSVSIAEPALFSLMPGGLLAGLTREQIADLIAFIVTPQRF